MNDKANSIFIISLTMSLLLFLLPPEFTWGVYSPNYLGWFWLLLCLPVTFISFVWSSTQDLKNRNWRRLIIRVSIFVSVAIISVVYWFVQAHKAGNL